MGLIDHSSFLPRCIAPKKPIKISITLSTYYYFQGLIVIMANGLYLLHGILMGTAWFFFAPLAIATSFARRCANPDSFLHRNDLWYKIHFYSGISAVLFTFVGFLIVYVIDADDQYEGSMDDDAARREAASGNDASFAGSGVSNYAVKDLHEELGIAIFAMALFQAFLGFIRPSAPKTTNKSDGIQKTQPTNDDPSSVGNTEMTSQASDGDLEADRENVHGMSSQHAAASADTLKKSKVRSVWEWSHRLFGITIVIAAWIECIIGINLIE
jgi:cytochrome b561